MEYYVVIGWRVFGKFTDINEATWYLEKIKSIKSDASPELLLKLRG